MNTEQTEIWSFLQQSNLFNGLSEVQLQHLAPLISEVSFKENEYLIHENEISDEIYFVKEGEVVIKKFEPITNKFMTIATLGAGSIVGEVTLLDDAPRSASVLATKSTVAFVLSINKLRALRYENKLLQPEQPAANSLLDETKTLEESTTYSQIIHNLAKNLSQRLRTANSVMVDSLRKELEEVKARMALGMVLITVISIMTIYTFSLRLLGELHHHFASTTQIAIPLIFIFAGLTFLAVKKTGYPLSFYGLTLKDWKISFVEGIVYSLPIMLLLISYKWVMIHYSVAFAHRELLEPTFGANTPALEGALYIAMYLLMVPLQEFVVRGALQSSLKEFLVVRHKIFWSVLLSNLMFGITHFHLSIIIGAIVFVPGLYWGWLYSKRYTLVGVTVSHLIIGAWAFFIVGIM